MLIYIRRYVSKAHLCSVVVIIFYCAESLGDVMDHACAVHLVEGLSKITIA